jgi:hypothetical protein
MFKILIQLRGLLSSGMCPHVVWQIRSYTLNREASGFSKTLENIYQTTQSHIPEDSNLLHHCHENLKYRCLQLKFRCWYQVTDRHDLHVRQSFFLSKDLMMCFYKLCFFEANLCVMIIKVFWDVKLYSLVCWWQCFEGTCCLHILPNYRVSHPRRLPRRSL